MTDLEKNMGNKKNSSKTTLLQLRCPACGAQLDYEEDDIEVVFCKFCGEKILLDNEARLKAKVELQKHKDRMEMKKKKAEEDEKWDKRIIIGFLVIGFGIPITILSICAISSAVEVHNLKKIEAQVEEYYMEGNYDAALFKAEQLVYTGSWTSGEPWDQKREAWIELIEKTKVENK